MIQPPGQLSYDDETHEYRVGRQRCKSVTGVAKIIPDSYALEAWDRRGIVEGLVRNPDLIEVAAAGLDNRDAMDRVVTDAKRAAGMFRKADRGSQIHKVLQWVLLGRTDLLLTARQRGDADQLARTLDKYRLTPTPWVENFVFYPELFVAGRFDAILEKSDGTPVLVDLKSGQNAIIYPQSASIQLAMYMNAPAAAVKVDTKGDRSVVTEWGTLPENLYRARGYVLLAEPGESIGSLHSVNTEHGWDAAQLALRIVQWRKELEYGKGIVRAVQIKASPPKGDEAVTKSLGGEHNTYRKVRS